MIRPIPLEHDLQILENWQLIHATCPTCLDDINWRHVEDTFNLWGSCCKRVYEVVPVNRQLIMYRVYAKQVDMTNVKILSARK